MQCFVFILLLGSFVETERGNGAQIRHCTSNQQADRVFPATTHGLKSYEFRRQRRLERSNDRSSDARVTLISEGIGTLVMVTTCDPSARVTVST